MVRREIKRQLLRYGTYLEPFELLLLLGIFIIPILALLNLSPQYGQPDQLPDNVLGVTSGQSSKIQDIGGSHKYIINERLLALNPTTYHYYTTITSRSAGTYGKPILQIKNPTENSTEVSFSVKYTIEQSSQVGIMDGSTNYIIKDGEGYLFPRTFKIPAGSTKTFYIDIRSDKDINYSEEIGLLIQLMDPTLQLTGGELVEETLERTANDAPADVPDAVIDEMGQPAVEPSDTDEPIIDDTQTSDPDQENSEDPQPPTPIDPTSE